MVENAKKIVPRIPRNFLSYKSTWQEVQFLR